MTGLAAGSTFLGLIGAYPDTIVVSSGSAGVHLALLADYAVSVLSCDDTYSDAANETNRET